MKLLILMKFNLLIFLFYCCWLEDSVFQEKELWSYGHLRSRPSFDTILSLVLSQLQASAASPVRWVMAASVQHGAGEQERVLKIPRTQTRTSRVAQRRWDSVVR